MYKIYNLLLDYIYVSDALKPSTIWTKRHHVDNVLTNSYGLSTLRYTFIYSFYDLFLFKRKKYFKMHTFRWKLRSAQSNYPNVQLKNEKLGCFSYPNCKRRNISLHFWTPSSFSLTIYRGCYHWSWTSLWILI